MVGTLELIDIVMNYSFWFSFCSELEEVHYYFIVDNIKEFINKILIYNILDACLLGISSSFHLGSKRLYCL